MRTVTQIIDALKSLKGVHTDAEIANLLGIKAKTLGAAKVRDNYPFTELITLCLNEGISFNWLVSGEGEPVILKGALDPSLVKLAIEATEKRLIEIKHLHLLEPNKKGEFIVVLAERCQRDDFIRKARGEKQKRLVKELASQYLKIL